MLYHVTDSIVYAQKNANDSPLGNFLGEFTDELDGDVITIFVSDTKSFIFFFCALSCLFILSFIYCVFLGGSKNYTYITAAGKTTCKVRGITINFRNSQILNFEVVKKKWSAR